MAARARRDGGARRVRRTRCSRAPRPGRSAASPREAGSRLLFFFQAEDGIRYLTVTGVQTCALPIFRDFAVDPAPVAGRLLGEIADLVFLDVDHAESPRRLDGGQRRVRLLLAMKFEIGRASCRERV